MEKRARAALFIVIALLVVVGVWIGQAGAQGGKTPVIWPAADIKWSDNPAIQGAKIAVLWGDPKTGAYGALKKVPGGNTLALHTHSQDQRVIMLAGSITLGLEGAAPKEMAQGSYAFIPAAVKHTAACKAGVDCVYFEEQQGASDIKFVGAPPAK